MSRPIRIEYPGAVYHVTTRGKRPDGCLCRLCRPDGFWGEIFLEKLRPLLDDKSKLTEVPRVQRYVSRPSLDDLLPRDALPDKGERDELIRRAQR